MVVDSQLFSAVPCHAGDAGAAPVYFRETPAARRGVRMVGKPLDVIVARAGTPGAGGHTRSRVHPPRLSRADLGAPENDHAG